jgi:PBP/GOBP family
MIFYQQLTMSQMEKTMETMRSICGPKFKLTDETIDGMKKGKFPENKDLKCYTQVSIELKFRFCLKPKKNIFSA